MMLGVTMVTIWIVLRSKLYSTLVGSFLQLGRPDHSHLALYAWAASVVS